MSRLPDNRLSMLQFSRQRPSKIDNFTPPNANSPFYNLTPSSTNHSDNASVTNNYHLTKMETNDSIDSSYSLQQQFKIQLNLNRKEIELIRYTWNKMLLDEPIVQRNTSLPIPGGFQYGRESMPNGRESMHTVQPSMHTVQPSKTASTIASSLFCRQLYGNLLAKDHTLEALFPSIKHQAVAFAGVLSFTVSQLESLSTLDDYLENLGKRHSRILGIEPMMFELMGEALIQTFHERFGNKFSQELEILWIKLYLYLANSILQFGIDPVLKLNKGENLNTTFGHNLFKLNEVNEPAILSTNTTNTNSSILTSQTVNSRNVSSSSDLFSIDDKRSSMSSNSPKKVKKSKKRDNCVVQ